MPKHSPARRRDDARLDRVFSALSDPTRRRMLERLTQGPASVSELAAPLKMSLPAVVQHLQVLEESGLVSSEKAGRVRTCRIAPAPFAGALDWINRQRSAWESRFDRLESLLEEMDDE
ncbi:MAG: metalloregulator ArsR/SmtB family transcription factor [Polyangiales bacterium]